MQYAQHEANSTVPSSLKKDITDAYLLMKRCEEELELLTSEMNNALEYWRKCAECIKQGIDDARADSRSQYILMWSCFPPPATPMGHRANLL